MTNYDTNTLSDAIIKLLERLDVARERNEDIVKHTNYYEANLGGDVRLYSLLFEGKLLGDHDLRQRLILALDRANLFDDSELVDYSIEFEGCAQFAPGVAWAHACCLKRRQVAVLPVPFEETPRGRVPITVADSTVEIAFVTEESQHVGFFRSVIKLERANRATFGYLARSAFPALEWADNVWGGLKDFSRPYNDVRGELVNYLGGLNDHGANCFHEYHANPQKLQEVLSLLVGTETSDENGNTKGNTKCKKDRTRCHGGANKPFWWHVKLQPSIDRIYFLYEPPSKNSHVSKCGRIVVGIFKDHCILPN